MPEAHNETLLRSILKTLSWRICATASTIALVWLWTGHYTAALAVGGLECGLKALLYLLHERFWNRITIGQTAASDPARSLTAITNGVLDDENALDLVGQTHRCAVDAVLVHADGRHHV